MSEIKEGLLLNGRYRLVSKIGKGGMANVWMAQDEKLSRRVAVKIMLPQFASDPGFVRRFTQEANAVSYLQDPYIVNIYDWGNDSTTGAWYIIMEYVAGQDLKRILTENGPLPARKAAQLAAQVCHALATAHSKDIIHRDIKPQNIMIRPDGNVKVMDFGIANAKNSTEQKTQAVLGTAHYVSPEQAQGLDLDARSDLYSLGIVLYEAVTGRLPFDGPDAVSIALKQVEEEPVPVNQINPNIDPLFNAIIMKALRKDPNDRFLSANEMGAALEAFASGRRDFSSATTQVIDPNGETRVMPRNNQNGDDEEEEEKGLSKKAKIGIGCAIAAAVVIIGIIIALVVGGNSTVAVPDVSGEELKTAIAEIEKSGLTVGSQTETPSATVEKGKVIGTDPEAGTEVSKGSKVNISVSSGPQQVEVPDLTGLTEEKAIAAIKAAGLTATRGQSEPSSTVAEGQILSQSPSKGAKVDAGTEVTYTLSTGPSTVEVPDLSGMTEAQAKEALTKLGLVPLLGSSQASDTVESGKVISQSISKGVKVETGTQVSYTISTGIATVNVPSLTGLSQSAARSTLINSGLTLGTVTEEYSDETKGTVIDQSVQEGSTAKKGTSVNITVSKGADPSKNKNTNTNANGNNTNGNGNEN